jgi:GNAT superfamily N-acetyltransferase
MFLVAVESERVMGFASFGPERSGDPQYRGEVYAIYVLKEAQSRRIGRWLMSAAASRLEEMGIRSALLWVLRDSPSRGFYERLGGELLRTQEARIGGVMLPEVAYGWKDLGLLKAAANSSPD